MNALVATVVVAGARWTERLPGPTIESPEEGSPGFAGFVATFLLAVAIIVLAVSFTRRMRRAEHRERLRARDAAPVGGDGAVATGDGTAAGDGVVAGDGAAGETTGGETPAGGAVPGQGTDPR